MQTNGSEGQPPGALTGYRVLDLAGELGVLCPRLLAGLGADVIRIEPPGGDPLRAIGPFVDDRPGPGRSLTWLALGGGRRSVTLDLASPAGRDAFLALVRSADFLVESCREELAALGLGYEDIGDANPRLIWVSMSAFGRGGPRSHWKATDLVGLAAGGLLYLCGDRDRPPVRVSVEQAYASTGTQAAAGAMMALHARNAFGIGQLVDVSMQGAAIALAACEGSRESGVRSIPCSWSEVFDATGRASEAFLELRLEGADRCRPLILDIRDLA